MRFRRVVDSYCTRIVLIQVMFGSGSIMLLACRTVADNSDGRYSSKHS
jgi:hypothetical protein